MVTVRSGRRRSRRRRHSRLHSSACLFSNQAKNAPDLWLPDHAGQDKQTVAGSCRAGSRAPDERTAMLSFCLGSLRSGKRSVGINAIAFMAIGLLFVAVCPRATPPTAISWLISRRSNGADLAILPGRGDLPSFLNQIELIRSGNVLTKVLESLENSAIGPAKQRLRLTRRTRSSRSTRQEAARFRLSTQICAESSRSSRLEQAI